MRERDGSPAVEIISTKPLVPAIQAIENPYRLVIDLPNSRLDVPQKRISVQTDQISTLRADQFQQSPPVARIVVDLLAPRAYTWEAAGNRLVVHLGKSAPTDANKSPFQPPTVPSLTPSPKPAVATVQMAGPVALIGSGSMSGSSISAGADTAILGLARGGEVHVCPGTTVSVTPSQNGHNVMLGVNTGAFEAHYTLDASSDSVITPDFRILLAGPGEFHYAFSADNHGNTCVRALPGNTASAIVSELMGDRTYQVRATDQLVFRAGHLEQVDMAVPLECGCPPPRQPVLRAENNLPEVKEAAVANSRVIALATNPEVSGAPGNGSSGVSDVPDPAAHPSEVHVQIEAPVVYRATDPPPAPVEEAQALPPGARTLATPPLTLPLAPPQRALPPAGTKTAATPQPHRGFFGKLRGFFAAMFR